MSNTKIGLTDWVLSSEQHALYFDPPPDLMSSREVVDYLKERCIHVDLNSLNYAVRKEDTLSPNQVGKNLVWTRKDADLAAQFFSQPKSSAVSSLSVYPTSALFKSLGIYAGQFYQAFSEALDQVNRRYLHETRDFTSSLEEYRATVGSDPFPIKYKNVGDAWRTLNRYFSMTITPNDEMHEVNGALRHSGPWNIVSFEPTDEFIEKYLE